MGAWHRCFTFEKGGAFSGDWEKSVLLPPNVAMCEELYCLLKVYSIKTVVPRLLHFLEQKHFRTKFTRH